jgi:hypothetical protein
VFTAGGFPCSVRVVSRGLCGAVPVFCARRFLCSLRVVSRVLCATFPVFSAGGFPCSVRVVSRVLCASFPVCCARRFPYSVRECYVIDRIFYVKIMDWNFFFYKKRYFVLFPFRAVSNLQICTVLYGCVY